MEAVADTDAKLPPRQGSFVVLRSRGVARVLVGSLLGRLPSGSVPLALLLSAQSNGYSIANAGILVGFYAGGTAVGGPVLARMIDRRHQLPILMTALAVSTSGLLLVVAAGAIYPVALGGSLIAGLGTPPLEACLRALWPTLLPPALIQPAYALDVSSQELIFVCGPLVTLAAVAAGGGSMGLVAAAAVQAAGTGFFAGSRSSREWRGRPAPRHWAGPLRERRLVILLTGIACSGAALGSMIVSVTAYAESQGSSSWAGWMLAVQALGALTGGILYSRRPATDLPRALQWLAVAMILGFVPLISVPPFAIALLLIPLSGIGLPPLLTVIFLLVDRLAPAGTVIEAFAWVATCFTIGSAVGSAVAGFVISGSGVRAGFVLAPGFATVAAVQFLLLKRRVHGSTPAELGSQTLPARRSSVTSGRMATRT